MVNLIGSAKLPGLHGLGAELLGTKEKPEETAEQELFQQQRTTEGEEQSRQCHNYGHSFLHSYFSKTSSQFSVPSWEGQSRL